MSTLTTRLNPNWIATSVQLPKNGQRVYASSKNSGELIKLIFNLTENRWYFEEGKSAGKYLSYTPEMWKERENSMWG
jgi:hypothetical protein